MNNLLQQPQLSFQLEESQRYWEDLLNVVRSTELHIYHVPLIKAWSNLSEQVQSKILEEFNLAMMNYHFTDRAYHYVLRFGVLRADKRANLGMKIQALKQLRRECGEFSDDNIKANLLYLFHILAGNAYADKKMYREAKKHYKKSIATRGHYAEAYFNKGIVYSETGRNKKALREYNKAIDINPDDYRFYNNRGYTYHSMEMYYEAIEDFTKSLEINPTNAKAFNNRGVSYAAMKKYEKAIKDYDTALSIDSNFSNAYNNRANALTHLELKSEAMKDYGKAMEVDPSKAVVIMHNRSRIFKTNYKATPRYNNNNSNSNNTRSFGEILHSAISSKTIGSRYLRV